MINLEILLMGGAELEAKFSQFPLQLQTAVHTKLVWLTALLAKKVEENVSGKLLEVKSGELKGSITMTVSPPGPIMTGFVGPQPASLKAWVQEYGGKNYYEILPSKADVLRFISKEGDVVFARSVNHPPLEARRYLRSALEEMPGEVYEAFLAAIDEAIAQ